MTETAMYSFSRAIYRELSPYVLQAKPSYQEETNRELVLRACERVMDRMLTDRRHFAKPARTLFNEVRIYFSLTSQLRAYMVIEHHISLALEYLSKQPVQEFDANGVPRACQAMTRRGSACQRQPLPQSDYCPSHQHLREDLEELAEVELVAA